MNKYVFPVALVFLFILSYHRIFLWLWNSWMNNPNYSHGPLIPLVSAFLIWRKRHFLRRLPKDVDPYGILICLLALLLHLFGLRASVNFVSSYSFILFLLGMVLFLYGRVVAKTLLFPLVYLIFMVPFIGLLMLPASNQLKVVSSITASYIMAIFDIPIFREGVILHLSNCSLEVADPCSGIRSLMSLLAIGALFAYLSNGSSLRQLVLFCSTIPLAIIGNVLRLIILLIIAETTGMVVVEGFLHTLIGFFVFATAMAGLFLIRRVIR